MKVPLPGGLGHIDHRLVEHLWRGAPVRGVPEGGDRTVAVGEPVSLPVRGSPVMDTMGWLGAVDRAIRGTATAKAKTPPSAAVNQ